MKLIRIIDMISQIEKSSFLKIIDNLSADLRTTNKEIEKILSESEGQIKNVDNDNIVKLFNLVKKGFRARIERKLQFNNFQLGLLIDIITRDGNSIMSHDWFAKLYNNEILQLKSKLGRFIPKLNEDSIDFEPNRKRDYLIYRNCVKTAYENDVLVNRDPVITMDEKSILNTLAQSLNLSVEEVRLIYYSIVPLTKISIDEIIGSLKELGIIFYKRKTNQIYIPDEIVWILRELIGIELPKKYFRRILRQLTDSEINRVSRKHNINRKFSRIEKIEEILNQGVNVRQVLLSDMYKDDISKTEKKNYILELMQKKLEIELSKYGATSEERVSILVDYFKDLEKDENLGMSQDGFIKLLKDLKTAFTNLNKQVKYEFELQQEEVLSFNILNDYSIKPRDILYLIPKRELIEFCKNYNIKTRGNIVSNILKNYKDTENLYLENYELFGKRDLNKLKERGINVKESELGLKYERLTKKIFTKLSYNVDEKLRKTLNTKLHQMDILLNLGNSEVIIVECKTIKDRNYNKYSSVSRQLKSYEKLCKNHGFMVRQILIVSNDFSDDFISECEYDYELNLSLITSSGLLTILDGYKRSSRTIFPTKLFLKGGLLDANRIVKVINK